MQNDMQTETTKSDEISTEKQKVIVVKSFTTAQSLCVDYPYFKYLISRKIDKDDPNGKHHVWLFEGYDPEFVETFLDLCEQSRQYHRNRIRIAAEGNVNASE